MRSPLSGFALLLVLSTDTAAAQDPAVASTPPKPALTEMLDSAALHAALARIPAAPAQRRIERVFVVAFDSTGQPRPPRAAAPEAMPESYREAVGPMIESALRPIEAHGRSWAIWLLVEAGNPPRIEEVQLEVQQPRVANHGVVYRELSRVAEQLVRRDTMLEGTKREVRVRMIAGADGRADSARVVQSSGIAAADSAALHITSIVRFDPMRYDGVPVRSWVVLPVVYVFPPGDEPAGGDRSDGDRRQ